MNTNTNKRFLNPRPSHCLTCLGKKPECKGGGPGEGSCVACRQRGLDCIWGPVDNENGDIENNCKAVSSDSVKKLTPERKLRKALGTPIISKISLPCPYFLRDPARARKNQACFGPGWDYTKLKEHLFHAHQLPIQCVRCHSSFDTQEKLRVHLLHNSQDMCKVSHTPKPDEGFNEDQAKSLRLRKSAGQTDLQKWKDIWMTLFPNDSDGDIRNPYDHPTLGNAVSPLYRYKEPRQHMVDDLADLINRHPDSMTVQEIQDGIRNVVLSETKLDSPTHLPLRSDSQSLGNPFVHRSRGVMDTRTRSNTKIEAGGGRTATMTSLNVSNPPRPDSTRYFPSLSSLAEYRAEKLNDSSTTAKAKDSCDDEQGPPPITRNPFSRAPTPSPLSPLQIAQRPTCSNSTSVQSFSPNRQRKTKINNTFFTEVEEVIRRAGTPNPSASINFHSDYFDATAPNSLNKEPPPGDPRPFAQNSVSHAMEKSQLVGAMGVQNAVKGNCSQACTSIATSKAFVNEADTSSGAILTPDSSKNSDNEDATTYCPPSTSFDSHSDSEELCNSSEDDGSQHIAADQVCPHSYGSTHGAEPSIQRYRPGQSIIGSRPTNSGSRRLSAASCMTSSIQFGYGPDAGNQKQMHLNRQSLDDKDHKADDRRNDGGQRDSKSTNADQKKLACPYYVRARFKHHEWRECYGPGWNDVHKTKEHVYLRHKLSPVCPRCCELFANKDELKGHQRAAATCDVKDPPIDCSDDGYTEEQEVELRKQGNQDRTEEEKWIEMYRILFPRDNRGNPEPYHGTETLFDRYMKVKTPKLWLQQTIALIERQYGPMSSGFRKEISSIPEKAEAESKRLYDVGQLGRQDSDDTATTLLRSANTFSNIDGSIPSTSALNQFESPFVHPTPIPDVHSSRQRRHTHAEITGSALTNAQHGAPNPLSTLSPRDPTKSLGASQAQVGQRPTSSRQLPAVPDAQYTQTAQSEPYSYLQPPQLTVSQVPTTINMNPMQSEDWINAGPFQIASTIPPWTPVFVPYVRPGTTPPIMSPSQYANIFQDSSLWASAPNPSALLPPGNNQGLSTTHTMRRGSLGSPQSLQGYASPQLHLNPFQPMTTQSSLSARHQHWDILTEPRPSSAAPMQPSQALKPPQTPALNHAKRRNPFGTAFPSIAERVNETDEPEHEVFGLHVDQSL